MKKTIRRMMIKRIISAILITTLVVRSCIIIHADDSEKDIMISGQEQIDINYIIQCEKFDKQCQNFKIDGMIVETEQEVVSIHDGIMSMLYDDVDEITEYNYANSVISNEKNIYSPDCYSVSADMVNLNNIITTEKDILFNARKVNGNDVILYSKNGNINFNCDTSTFGGIIYAPNGNVCLEGRSIDINGIIIAKNIIIRANDFRMNCNEKIASYLQELEFFKETIQPSLSVIEEDEKIKLFWSEYSCNSNTDIYVRYNDDMEFTCIDNIESSEYLLSSKAIKKCDFRIVLNLLGETYKSDIVTISYDSEGVIQEKNIDTDDDLIPDGYEIWDLNTDPYNKDTDGDGIFDGYEVLVLGSDPCRKDSEDDYDKDNKSNLEEFLNNTNPWLKDSDFDGIDDTVDEYPLKPVVGKDFQVNLENTVRVGMFDIVNKYIVDGVEQEYIYNFLTQETIYSRIGDTYSVKYMDSYGNIQSLVKNRANGMENVTDAQLYDYDQNGCLLGVSSDGVSYEFEYDDNYRMIKSLVNGNELISYNYDKNNNISEMILGNGNIAEYKNDGYGNVIEEYYEDELVATYEYDKSGNLIKTSDLLNEIDYKYTYIEDELNEVTINDKLTIKYHYGENAFDTIIEYNDNIYLQLVEYSDNSYSMKLLGDDNYKFLQLEENKYKEEITCNDKIIRSNIYEMSAESETGESIQQINKMYSNTGDEYTYKYDENGNITEIYFNNNIEKRFHYNIYNELVCESDFKRGEKYQYYYNKRGNVINSTISEINDMSLGIIHCYEYDNEKWRDLLTSIDGNSVVYDEIGNPLKYGNAIMTWTKDSMLESIQLDNDYIEYIYDISGNRISKNVNGIKTNYITDGEFLLGKEVNGTNVWYVYNGIGKVIGLVYDGNNYYYEKDIFNSIRNIVDINGNKVCSYEYDAWGNILDVKGNKELAEINDFRYQSYVYDEETGFYYLNSRYYDPANYRFINADSIFSSMNLFTYCENNPTNYSDPSGKAPIASVYGSNIISVSNWGLPGIGYKVVNSDSNGGYFYKISSGKKVYFNCYLWALNKYSTNTTYNDPGGYKGISLSYHFTVDEVYNLVKKDAKVLNYGFKAAAGPNIPVSSGQKLIALRTTTTDSPYYKILKGWDYHFMKKMGNTWTYKGGKAGRIFELNSAYTPGNVQWNISQWDLGNKRWYIRYTDVYTSKIKYFILTY